MEDEVERMIEDFTKKMRATKFDLSSKCDAYLKDFKDNVSFLKEKSSSFKETAGWIKNQSSKNGERLARLTNISYFSKDPNETTYKPYKEESHRTVCELRNLKKEVSKHSMEFYVSELEKMSTHHPMFAHTKSSGEYLKELREKLEKDTNKARNDFKDLFFETPHIQFKHVFAEPKIFTSLGESRVNCLTNMKNLSKQSHLTSTMCETSHATKITCVLNVDDEIVASGSLDGEVSLIEYKTGIEKAQFVLKNSNRVTALGRIRADH